MKTKLIERLKTLKQTGLFDIFGSGVIVKVIGFLSSIILIRLVSKEQYGVFTVAWNMYSIAMLASGFGALYSMLQMASESGKDLKRKFAIYAYSWKFGFRASICICVVIVLLGLFYPYSIGGVRDLTLLMGLLPIVQFCVEYQSTFFRTEKKNRVFSVSNILNVWFVLVFSVLGVLLFEEKGFIIGRYFAYIALTLFGWFVWKVPIRFKSSTLQEDDRKDFIHIALVSMANGGISQLLYLLDVFVLGIVIPDESVIASYKVATVIPTALSFIPSALITYIYPYFAENKDNPTWCLKQYKFVTAVIGVINLVISISLVVSAPFLIRIVYGNDYMDAVDSFRILSISYFFSGTFRAIAGNLLVTQRMLRFNTFVAVLSGGINIILDFFLVSSMGSSGAAYATLAIVMITSILNTSYLLHVFRKKGAKDENRIHSAIAD